MLEGLAEVGLDPLAVIDGWQSSDLGNISLRNYLYEHYPYDPILYRPGRMRPRVQAFDGLVARLRLRSS
jgi:hypothetical protein